MNPHFSHGVRFRDSVLHDCGFNETHCEDDSVAITIPRWTGILCGVFHDQLRSCGTVSFTSDVQYLLAFFQILNTLDLNRTFYVIIVPSNRC
jgi:hypothetical protein